MIEIRLERAGRTGMPYESWHAWMFGVRVTARIEPSAKAAARVAQRALGRGSNTLLPWDWKE